MRRQHGVVESPTLPASVATGTLASVCRMARILRSIRSMVMYFRSSWYVFTLPRQLNAINAIKRAIVGICYHGDDDLHRITQTHFIGVTIDFDRHSPSARSIHKWTGNSDLRQE